MNDVLAAIWAAVNSPAGITVIAGALLWLLNWFYAKNPTWQAYEGAIVQAVKLAEKAIPDDTANAGLLRLDYALKWALKIFEETNGRRARAAEVASLKDGISVIHAELEASGNLTPKDGA